MMKTLCRKLFSALLALSLPMFSFWASPALAAGTGEALYSNTVELAEGFQYTNTISSPGSRVESYMLSVSPDSGVRPIVKACDTIYGGMTIDQIVRYTENLGYNVVGAMNADFGYWSTRIPCGVVAEDGIYKSSPEQNNALAFTEDGAFVSIMPSISILLETADGGTVELTHYNKTREDTGGLYLYSEYFSTVSTRTSTDGWAVRFKVVEGQIRVSGTMKLQVESLYEGKEASYIGEGYMVLTAAAASELDSVFEQFQVGDTVTLTTSCSDERLIGADWISGCGDILLYGGEIYRPDGWNSSISGNHPRTCVGIKPDGTLLFRVVDGRSAYSAGATMMQLAEDFLAMGCVYAVNMDGGGSSAVSLRLPGDKSAGVINRLSDGVQRSCPSYFLFVTDKSSDGVARRLFLQEDGAFVLAGSSLPLHFLATDSGLRKTGAPGDAAAQSTGLGSVKNGVYTAGSEAGVDTVHLSSGSAGIEGSATIHVITKADTLFVTNADTGLAVDNIRLDEGKTLRLSASVNYLKRAVVMDERAVSYSVAGDIGTISKDGLFTASQTWGAEGTITVSAAGLSRSIPVRIGADFDDIGKHWARAHIESLYRAGIVKGVSATSFSPDTAMKRGDFVLMLYRAAGSPALTGAGEAESGPEQFSDVPEDAYYTAAIAWAQARDIARGTGNGLFQPEGTLTREQAFTFVYRALPVLGRSVPQNASLPQGIFADAAELSDWATEPTAALVEMGLVQGSGGKLEPQGLLTRSQMAKILDMAL